MEALMQDTWDDYLWIYLVESICTKIPNLPTPTGKEPGIGWDLANKLRSSFININGTARIQSIYKMVAMWYACFDIAHHSGPMHDLSTRAVAALSATGYDTMDKFGTIPVGGLNNNDLTETNAFANSGAQFPEVKSALMEHARERFEFYRTHTKINSR